MGMIYVALAGFTALAWIDPRKVDAGPHSEVMSGEVDLGLITALVDVALSGGASLPRAIAAVGHAVDGRVGTDLVLVGTRMGMGSNWDDAIAGIGGAASSVVRPLEDAWRIGAAPGPLLAQAAERRRQEYRSHAAAAASQLGVRAVLPLAVCFLPAFLLLGLAPVVISLARGLMG